jgi:hypothetical protein
VIFANISLKSGQVRIINLLQIASISDDAEGFAVVHLSSGQELTTDIIGAEGQQVVQGQPRAVILAGSIRLAQMLEQVVAQRVQQAQQPRLTLPRPLGVG